MARKKAPAPTTGPTIDADTKAELAALRDRIDACDDRLIEVLNERAAVAQSIGRIKTRANLKAYVPERERQVLDRVTKKSPGPLGEESLRLIYKEIISASLALESPLEVAYLGPEATFTHDAAKRHFGMSARLKPCRTIPEVFEEVEHRRCEYGVVPIENSTEGIVNHTLDMFVASELGIAAEVQLEVAQHLLTLNGKKEGIHKIVSHPQALAQCRHWLSQHLPGVPMVDVESTGRAAEMASKDPAVAAVASELAASLYDLRITDRHIEDLRGNVTRFLVIGAEDPPPTKSDRTSIMFALKDAPGILYKALQPFAKARINLSRIESRPSRRRAWDYLFFIDLEGHKAEPRVAGAIAGLKRACSFIKVLGSYPRAKSARELDALASAERAR